MLLGLFIRNFKGYAETIFIPLSKGDNFSGLIGDNGVGKTTVLQAIDVFFNGGSWQKNVFMQRNSDEESFIQPVFLIPKERIPQSMKDEADMISNQLWQFKRIYDGNEEEEEEYIHYFGELLVTLPERKYQKSHYLLTVGVNSDLKPDNPVFPTVMINNLPDWQALIDDIYRYLFIPITPDPEQIVKLADPDSLPEINDWISRYCEANLNSLSIPFLDSGEKQLLAVDLIRHIIENQNKKITIIGFDEPEASLQTSGCYDHFERIYDLHNYDTQIVLTSHWYGFIPLLMTGLLINIVYNNHRHKFIRFDISRFREDIKIRKKVYMEKYHEELPVDVALKSSNDFIQSVLGSIIAPTPYNWLICEGSSEKVYFNYYFADEIKNNRLRIVPVGGCREVKKIYNYLTVPFQDLRDYIGGKIVLLIDTDTQLLEFDTYSIPDLYCYRLINTHGETQLAHIKANPKGPATEIEDVLNGKAFHKALLYFKREYPELLDFVTEDEKPEIPSYYAMDLSPSQYEKMEAFFDAHHYNKSRFAAKYIEICRQGDYAVPEWIRFLKRIYSLPDFDPEEDHNPRYRH